MTSLGRSPILTEFEYVPYLGFTVFYPCCIQLARTVSQYLVEVTTIPFFGLVGKFLVKVTIIYIYFKPPTSLTFGRKQRSTQVTTLICLLS
jgi:hypothetical protein